MTELFRYEGDVVDVGFETATNSIVRLGDPIGWFEGFKARSELGSSSVGGVQVAVGLVVSFFVAWGVISVFIKYLQRRGLEPFGFYRIALSAAVLWLALKG